MKIDYLMFVILGIVLITILVISIKRSNKLITRFNNLQIGDEACILSDTLTSLAKKEVYIYGKVIDIDTAPVFIGDKKSYKTYITLKTDEGKYDFSLEDVIHKNVIIIP